jgi:hypothetical protein
VCSAAHSTASIYQPAFAPFAVFMGRNREEPVGSRNSKLQTQKRLAITLKLAIGALQSNIRKLERTGGSPLLIATRKKRLAKMQEELAILPRWTVQKSTEYGTAVPANSAGLQSASYSASLGQVFGTARAQGSVTVVTDATAFLR